MLKLIIAISKKSGNRYCAIAAYVKGKTTFLTFDKTTIVRMLDMTYSQLENIELGEYNITEKGELE